MDKDEIGESFHYPDKFLLLLGYAKAYFHLPYRQTKEGIAQGHAKGKIPDIPNYMYNKQRRINRLNIKIKEDNKTMDFEDEYIIIAIYIAVSRFSIEANGCKINGM